MPAFSTSSKQHHRRAANHRRVGDQQRPGLAARKLRHPVVHVDRLAGQLVGEVDRLLDQHGVFAAAGPHPRVRQQELAHRHVGEERGVLRDQGDGVARRIVAELGRGRLAVDQHAPAAGRVAVGEQFDVVDQRRLARAGRADDADDLSHLEVDAAEGFGSAVAAVAAEDADGLNHERFLVGFGAGCMQVPCQHKIT